MNREVSKSAEGKEKKGLSVPEVLRAWLEALKQAAITEVKQKQEFRKKLDELNETLKDLRLEKKHIPDKSERKERKDKLKGLVEEVVGLREEYEEFQGKRALAIDTGQVDEDLLNEVEARAETEDKERIQKLKKEERKIREAEDETEEEKKKEKTEKAEEGLIRNHVGDGPKEGIREAKKEVQDLDDLLETEVNELEAAILDELEDLHRENEAEPDYEGEFEEEEMVAEVERETGKKWRPRHFEDKAAEGVRRDILWLKRELGNIPDGAQRVERARRTVELIRKKIEQPEIGARDAFRLQDELQKLKDAYGIVERGDIPLSMRRGESAVGRWNRGKHTQEEEARLIKDLVEIGATDAIADMVRGELTEEDWERIRAAQQSLDLTQGDPHRVRQMLERRAMQDSPYEYNRYDADFFFKRALNGIADSMEGVEFRESGFYRNGVRVELTGDDLTEYVTRKLQEIVQSGFLSHESANQYVILDLVNLMTNDLSDYFSDISTFPDELRDKYEAWLSTWDFTQFFMSAGSAEAVKNVSSKIDPEHYGRVLKEKQRYWVLVDYKKEGESGYTSQKRKVDIGVGDYYRLLETEYWSSRILSMNKHVRDQARQDMLEHLVAVDLGIRSFGDYERFYGGSIEERMRSDFVKNKGNREGVVQIRGIFNTKDSEDPLKGGTSAFFNKVSWSHKLAEGIWYATGRSVYWDPLFEGNQLDWHAKILRFQRYLAKFGIGRKEFWDLADLEYKDFITERFGELHYHIDWILAHGEGEESYIKGVNGKKLKGSVSQALKRVMLDKEGFMISSGRFLEDDNFQKLFAASEEELRNGRFSYLSNEEWKETKEAIRFLKEVNWQEAVAMFRMMKAGNEQTQRRKWEIWKENMSPEGSGDFDGVAGFRKFLEEYDTAVLNWGDYEMPRQLIKLKGPLKSIWRERKVKYYGYLNDANAARGGLLAGDNGLLFIPNWKNLANNVRAFSWFGNEQTYNFVYKMYDKIQWMQKFQLGFKVKESRPDGSGIVEGFNEEGVPIYAEAQALADRPGRLLGFPSIPDHKEIDEINKLFARGLLTYKLKEQLISENVEDVMGIRELMPKPLADIIFGFDVATALGAEETWARFLVGRTRVSLVPPMIFITPGSILRFVRKELSYIRWEEFLPEAVVGYLQQIGVIVEDQTKKA